MLVRCSQPTVGIWYWRCQQDEDYFKSIAEACAYDSPRFNQAVAERKSSSGTSHGKMERSRSHPLEQSDDEMEIDATCTYVLELGNARKEEDRLSYSRQPSEESVGPTDEGLFNGHEFTENNEVEAKIPKLNIKDASDATDPMSDIQSLYSEARQQKDIKRALFVDARSYTNAIANRARGGGFEYSEYYHNSCIQFMNLDNIHNVRKMHQGLAQLMAQIPETGTWLSAFEGSRWLYYLSLLLKASQTVCHAIAVEGRPVVVHCSDGWDRTPQITALSQIMLDPYYRTFEGFEVLVEREWFEFGHKFADRCGSSHPGSSERCPVFLQWLDAIHQLLHQFPQAFQFNQAYLVKLSQHIYSNLFGSFLHNTSRERVRKKLFDNTYPVWSIFNVNSHKYINFFYSPTSTVLHPSCHSKDLKLWDSVYKCPTLIPADEINLKGLNSISTQNGQAHPGMDETGQGDLVKTRSCDDLTQQTQPALVRHASDGNLKDNSATNLCLLSSAIGSDIENSENIELTCLQNLPEPQHVDSNNSSDSCENSNLVNKFGRGKNGVLSNSSTNVSRVVDADDTLCKLKPVCKCIETKERKLSHSSAPNDYHPAVHRVPTKHNNGGALVNNCACLPAEQTGIPEASKKGSEVASEISSGHIERAVEADENGFINSESEHENTITSNSQMFNQRMLKSDSDVGASFFGNGCIVDHQLDVTKGSTDTLVYNEKDLGGCSHHPCSDRKQLEESIVEHLMRKKIQGCKECSCSEDNHVFCHICQQSSKLLSDLDSKKHIANATDSSINNSSLTSSVLTGKYFVHSSTNSVNGGSGSGSKVTSTKSTPGHSRTPSTGCGPQTEDERYVCGSVWFLVS